MKKAFLLFLLLFFLVISIVTLASAKQYHATLLTVSETEDERAGGTADLYLEIKSGSGRIFIDSFPLSQLDTQIVTRFSKEIACDFLQKDCTRYDFFYTIRANTAIVGGPSAGASTTMLTIAALDNLQVKDDVAMTGTINSGGLIGPVGGINEKVSAAQEAGIEKVLIPNLALQSNQTNQSTNISNFNIEVIEVSTIEEALYQYTGKDFSTPEKNITIPKEYSETMQKIALQLCNRTQELDNELDEEVKTQEESHYNASLNFINKSKTAMQESKFYSAASYCFSANLRLKTLMFRNKTNEELLETSQKIQTAIDITNEKLEKNFVLRTIGDLETFMVVKERLVETQDFLNEINNTNISYEDVAYAQERYYSAASWSEFYGAGGKEFELDQESLKKGCLNKLAEAEERINYVNIYLPIEILLEETQKELKHAYKDYKNQDYALCLFKASKAKAEADVLMTLIALGTEDALKEMLGEKLGKVKKTIIREQEKGIFPILGYSYYEYSNNLVEESPYNALTFTEYALEMSNLDIYFPKKKTFHLPNINSNFLITIIASFLAGLIAGLIVKRKKKKKRK